MTESHDVDVIANNNKEPRFRRLTDWVFMLIGGIALTFIVGSVGWVRNIEKDVDMLKLLTITSAADHELLGKVTQTQQMVLARLDKTPTTDILKAQFDMVSMTIETLKSERQDATRDLKQDIQGLRDAIITIGKELHQHELETTNRNRR